MPMPEGSQLSQDFSPILTTLSMSFLPKFAPAANGLGGFVAAQIFKNVSVGSPDGTFPVFSRADFMRIEAKKLANGEPAPIGGFGVSKAAYSTDNYGIAANWTARDLAEARRGGYAEAKIIRAKTLYVTGQCIMRREIDTATLIQTAANWTLTYAGVTAAPTGPQFVQWDQVASSPVDDVIVWGQAMFDLCGFRPNTMVIPRLVWNALRRNQSLIDRIKYGGTMDKPTQITLQQLKALFEIDDIYVVEAQYNSAPENLAAVYASIWATKTMWLGYIAPGDNPDGEEPSAGYAFTWDGSGLGLPAGAGTGPASFDAVANPDGIFIRNYDTKRPAARYVEAELWTTPNVTAADLGMTMTAVIA
jgi:hypothetical protein